MGNTIAQPILRVVPPLTNQGESPPPPVPVVPPLSGAALLPPLPPPPPADLAAPAPEAPCEYPPAPDVVAIVREFAGPSGDKMPMMTAYGYPVFLRQAVEALARDACRGQQHTVAALLDRGLPFLRQIPGLLECLDARQMLLRVSCNQFTRQFLDHIVALDLPTAGLGDTQFGVRVDREQHGGIGVVAAAAGLPAHQSFTLALTAALIGSAYPPMREANNAMFGTLTEFHQRCRARALHCETLLSAEQPEAPTFRWTINDVLDRQDR